MDSSVDVKYEHSGTTTIRISGSPIPKRREKFETGQTTLQEESANGSNKPNESAKVIISSIPTALPDADADDSNAEFQTYDKKSTGRKRVQFMEAVVINEDESTQLSPSDENETLNQSEVSTDDVQIVHVEDLNSNLKNADEPHPLKQQKLKLKEAGKEAELTANGTAVVPIVDEYELHELSAKLSSKDGVDAGTEIKTLTEKSEKTEIKELKSRSRNDRGRSALLWVAVVVMAMALAGIIALAILYTRQFRLEDDAVRKLKSRLDLRSPSNTDLFLKAPLSSTQDSVVYYLPENKDYIPWQKPNRSAVISWHRGVTLNVYTIRNARWRGWRLGDTYEDRKAIYSLVLSTDTWYAARLDDVTDSYALVSTASTDGTLGWIQSTNLAAQYPELKDDIRAFNRP